MEDKEAEAAAINRFTERLARERAERITNVTAHLLSTPDGREFLWWLLERGKWGTQPFAADPSRTAFGCGELNVGQQIFELIISTDPAGFTRMQEDQVDARRNHERAARDARSGDGYDPEH